MLHKLSLLALLGAAASSQLILDDGIISRINNDPSSTWTAGRNPRFEDVTLEEAKMLLGVLDIADDDDGVSKILSETNSTTNGNSTVKKNPLNFDSRDQWPGCIGAIRNQGHCGGCWAFGATETLSDRFCIASKGAINVTLSPQDLISCGHVRTPPKYMLGCDGGVPEYAWKYLESTGISTDPCIPFIGNTTEVCPTQCNNTGGDFKKYKVAMGSSRLLNGASSAAQQAISTTGPIQAVFYVYQDFFAYKSGVYKHTNATEKYLGKHSIKIVGYGIDDTAGNYWTVANSWGTSFGMDGFFKIGLTECMIDSEMTFGNPLLR
jgi:cathepsin B